MILHLSVLNINVNSHFLILYDMHVGCSHLGMLKSFYYKKKFANLKNQLYDMKVSSTIHCKHSMQANKCIRLVLLYRMNPYIH